MEISFVLYKPAVPENIGAAARAIKTMGFKDLRLILPADHLSQKARMLAHGSNDILESAGVFDRFEECTQDLDFLVGTTARKRIAREDYIPAEDLKHALKIKEGHIRQVGIIFGSEESGLPNELLGQCDTASTITIKNPYPSLNLGQAVMLYAYELSGLSAPIPAKENQDVASLESLKSRVESIINTLGIPDDMPLKSRILERISAMNSTDINLLHSVSSRLAKYFKIKD